jgi:hypothetical protein
MASRLSGASTSFSRDQEHAGGKPWPISHRRAVLGNPAPSARVGACRRGRARAPSRQRFVRLCGRAVLARADHFVAGDQGRARHSWVTRSARVPTARAPTIGPFSDKTRPTIGRIRPDLLTRIRGRLSIPVWGRLGTSGDVAVRRAGCSQNRGEIGGIRTRQISHAEISGRERLSEDGCTNARTCRDPGRDSALDRDCSAACAAGSWEKAADYTGACPTLEWPSWLNVTSACNVACRRPRIRYKHYSQTFRISPAIGVVSAKRRQSATRPAAWVLGAASS